MKNDYLETIGLIERLHRLFLEVVKCELDRLKVEDINNVQAMVLYNLGEGQVSIGELTTKGCYLGSNVSYNLKKMVQNGYVDQCASKHDKRSYMIKLSPKGMLLCRKLDAALDKHVAVLSENGISSLSGFAEKLRMFEEFWRNISLQGSRFVINLKKR